jgi:hypothetical protein
MKGAACEAIHSAMISTATMSGRLVRNSGNAGCSPSPRAPSDRSAAMPVLSPFSVTSVIEGSRLNVAACVHSMSIDNPVPAPKVNKNRCSVPHRRGVNEIVSAPKGR